MHNCSGTPAYQVSWQRQQPLICTARVANGEGTTKLEWVVDSDYRLFPVVPDEIFGYVLHPVDLATNKVMAAAGRRELRDLVDLVTIHETILPLGAVIWSATDKAPGFTPEGIIGEIRRNSNYPISDWEELPVEKPLDPVGTMNRLRLALRDAEDIVLEMPTGVAGLLFLEDGRIVQPNPANLHEYETHGAMRRGHWPGSSEVTSAMLESYRERR